MRLVKTVLERVRRLDAQVKILVKNSSWVFAANGVDTVLSFVKSIIFARGLGVELYGQYVIIIAFVGAMQQFFNLNLGTAVIKFGADYVSVDRHDKLMALLKIGLLFSVALAVLCVVVIVVLVLTTYDTFIDLPGLASYIILYAVVSSMSFWSSISGSLLRLYYKFRLNSLVTMGLGVVKVLVMGAVVLVYPRQLVPFLISIIIFSVTASLVYNATVVWELKDTFKAHLGAKMSLIKEDLRTIGGFVLSNSGSGTLNTLINRGEVLLLGALAGATQVGYYEIAKKLAYMIMRFTQPLKNAIYPQLASLIADNRLVELKAMLVKITKVLAIFASIGLVVAFFVGEVVIGKLYGQEFLPAVYPFLIHLFVAAPSAMCFWALPLIHSLGKVQARLIIMIMAVVMGAPLAYILASISGAVGVSIASLIMRTFILFSLVGVAYHTIHSNRELPVSRLV